MAWRASGRRPIHGPAHRSRGEELIGFCFMTGKRRSCTAPYEWPEPPTSKDRSDTAPHARGHIRLKLGAFVSVWRAAPGARPVKKLAAAAARSSICTAGRVRARVDQAADPQRHRAGRAAGRADPSSTIPASAGAATAARRSDERRRCAAADVGAGCARVEATWSSWTTGPELGARHSTICCRARCSTRRRRHCDAQAKASPQGAQRRMDRRAPPSGRLPCAVAAQRGAGEAAL